MDTQNQGGTPAPGGANLDLLKSLISQTLSGVLLSKYEVQSIAEQARRSIMMYRVLVSASIREIPLAGDISKYLEGMYAIFTLLVLGFNPMASTNSDVKKLLDKISAESYNPTDLSVESMGLGFDDVLENAMRVHEQRKALTRPRIGRSAEAYDSEGADDELDSYEKYANDDDVPNRRKDDNKSKKDKEDEDLRDVERQFSGKGANYTADETKTTSLGPNGGSVTKTSINVQKKVAASDITETSFLSKLEEVKAYPTIIKMKITTTDRSTVTIPIAIKANCYGIKTNELRLLIESGISGKPADILRKAKWRSGEISTMMYIFGTDYAERDKKLYAELGRNPWYIELQARKAASKGNAIVNATSLKDNNLYKETKDYLKLKGDIPPTASLIVTKDDIVAATRLDSTRFTKNDAFIKKFMKEMYLLCLGIVDNDLQMVSFYFLGYDSPFIQSFTELAKSSKDPNQALFEAVKELSRKVY